MREPLHRLSAVRLAQMIAQGEASSEVVKVTEATLVYVATGEDRKPRPLPPLPA